MPLRWRRRRPAKRVSADEAYTLWAGTYGDPPNPFQRLESGSLYELMPRLGGKRVLDLGCGRGRVVREACEGGAKIAVGIDRVLKQHYDTHRAAGTVPPELIGQIPGALYDGKRIAMPDLRNWRKGLTVTVGPYDLSTALDDLLYDATRHCYNMIDYKSKAKETNEEDTQKY